MMRSQALSKSLMSSIRISALSAGLVWKNVVSVLFTKSNGGWRLWENINLKINGLDVSAPAGSTILEAAHLAGIKIPTYVF